MPLTKRQNEIIDAAITLIARRGICELTVKNLAASIGVTEPALYRHFTSKTEIIRNLILRFDEAYPEAENPEKGFQAIRKFVEVRTNQLLRQPALSKVMYCEEFFISDPDFTDLIMQMMNRHKKMLSKHLAEGIESGEIVSGISPEILFRLVMGPFRFLFKQWGMSGMKFDLRLESRKLLEALELLLRKEPTK